MLTNNRDAFRPRSFFFTAAALATTILLTAAARGAPKPLTLCSPTVTPVVVIPRDASGEVRQAAEELQRCLELMTGQCPELTDNTNDTRRPALFIGSAALGAGRVDPIDLTELGPEGVVIRTLADGVALVGKSDTATRHAAYGFLERLGCRWYFAGDVWEEIPRQTTVVLEPLDIQRDPDFILRSIWYGYGTGPIVQSKEDYLNWKRRNRMGGWLTGSTGHAYANIARPDRHYAEHPEWFPLVKGERLRGGQLCLSNPEVRQRAIEYARNKFRSNPQLGMVSLSPNDGGGYCECEPCQALGSVSDQTLGLANTVAEAIHDEFPDRYVGMYAYAGNSAPPTIQGHPNVIIFIATSFITRGYTVDGLVAGWSKQVSRIGIRDYYNVLIWHRDMPRSQVAGLRERIPFYHANKAVGISAESSNNWGPEGLNYYVASKLMWDVHTDVDALVEDFYTGCWHRAAPAMRRYYDRWAAGDRMTSRTLALCYRDLDEAADLAAGDPVAVARVDRMRMYLHWVYLYHRHGRAATHNEQIETAREAMHFAWRIRETSMIHSYAQFRELRIWRGVGSLPKTEVERWKTSNEPPEQLKAAAPDRGLGEDETEDLTALMNLPGDKAAGPGKPQPQGLPSHEEIEKLFKADLTALPPPLDVDAKAFSKDLVPITNAFTVALTDRKETFPAYRGNNHFVLYAEGRTLSLDVKVGRSGEFTMAYTLSRYDTGTEMAAGEVAIAAQEFRPLRMDVPEPGAYLLTLGGGGLAASQRAGNSPVSLVASRDRTAHVFGGAPRLYFFVPKGTRSFAFGFTTPDNYGALIIRNPAGDTVLDQRGSFVTGEEFVVQVPEGTGGQVWSLTIQKCEDATGMYLLGVPPYLSQLPQQLLVPRETAEP